MCQRSLKQQKRGLCASNYEVKLLVPRFFCDAGCQVVAILEEHHAVEPSTVAARGIGMRGQFLPSTSVSCIGLSVVSIEMTRRIRYA
jgi:hypothetical protein